MKKKQGSFKQLFCLDGKNALVTGGTGLLGRYFAKALAEFGANVAVLDQDEKTCHIFAAELTKKYRIKALGVSCDLRDPASVKEAVLRVHNSLGPIHILHNNAATKTDNPREFFESFERYPLERWREIMSVNIDGMFLMAQAVGSQMIKQGIRGSIIQTSSIYGWVAPDQGIYKGSFYAGGAINTPAVYTTSKAAVLGLTKHLATLWGAKGIRVNAIVPGGVQSGQNTPFVKRYSARVPLGRMAKPEEMTGALIYLASDASSYVTGQSLVVDGGLSAW